MKRLFLLSGIVLALFLAYWFGIRSGGWQSMSLGGADFAIEDTAAITRIYLTRTVDGKPKERVELTRKPGGAWYLQDGKRAFQPRVRSLLEVMHLIELRQTLNEKGQATGNMLFGQRHTLVEAYVGKDLVKIYEVGTATPDQRGTLVRRPGRKTPYVVHRPGYQGYLNPFYSQPYTNWRENLLFVADSSDLRRLSVRYKNPENSLVLERSGPASEWTLNGNRPDPESLQTFLSGFDGRKYAESFAAEFYPGVRDSLKMLEPDIRFMVDYFERPSRELLLYARPAEDNPNNYFGWAKGEEELLTIQRFVMDKYLEWPEPISTQ